MKRILLLMIIAGYSGLLAAQIPDPQKPQGENLKVPEGWEIRLDTPMESLIVSDDPENADIYFVNMTPGWHLTTGPRAIFYHPENVAKGNYEIHTKLHLFNTNGRDREGYGLFFGGSDLQGDDQYYLYFLLRNTGDYLIKARTGADTKMVKGWTASDAIVKYEDESVSSVENDLKVSVNSGIMSFYINDTKVAEMPAGDWETDGLFGLRVNHAVNLHIEDLGMMSLNQR